MTAEVAQPSGVRAVLAIPGFRNLWIGHVVSQVGDGVAVFTMLLLVNEWTGSTASLATMALALCAPQLMFGVLAGVFVDRGDRRRILIVSDLIRAVLVLGFLLVRRAEDVWVFYVIGFAQASVGTFFEPARAALLPSIVDGEQLLTANSLSLTSGFIARVFGLGLAGAMFGFAHSGFPAFCLDALTFLVSALFISRIAAPPRETSHVATGLGATLHQLVEGLRFVASERAVMALMVVLASMSFALGAEGVVAIPFLVNVLGVQAEALSLIRVAEVVGMVAGMGLMTLLPKRLGAGRLMVAAGIGMGAFIVLTGAGPYFTAVLFTTFATGVCATPVNASIATLTQSLVPDEMRGRVNSAVNTVFTAATVVAIGVAGTLGAALGSRRMFYLMGSIMVLSGLAAAVLLRTQRPRQAP